MTVHPHPDDESIACGGMLARYADEGVRVVVVTCTGGEEGENLAGIDLGGDDLPAHRRRELADALAALGVSEHVWLGYRDSGMAGTTSNDHPDSFHRGDVDEAGGRLAEVLRRVRPDVVVSENDQGTYGHPDHVKAHHVTARAVALAAEGGDGEPWRVAKRYAHALSRSRLRQVHERLTAAGLASPFGDEELAEDVPFGTPDDAITTRVDVRPWLARKRGAMAAHRSQIGSDSFFLNLPDDVAADTFGVEELVLLDGAGPAGGVEDDLFAGLRD